MVEVISVSAAKELRLTKKIIFESARSSRVEKILEDFNSDVRASPHSDNKVYIPTPYPDGDPGYVDTNKALEIIRQAGWHINSSSSYLHYAYYEKPKFSWLFQ